MCGLLKFVNRKSMYKSITFALICKYNCIKNVNENIDYHQTKAEWLVGLKNGTCEESELLDVYSNIFQKVLSSFFYRYGGIILTNHSIKQQSMG